MNKSNHFYENKIELSSERIHVFLLELNSYDSEIFLPNLSDEEYARANKLKIEEKKNNSL